jgi:alkylation response protein AidB-like acyl-CoA dehydrogenase
MCSASEQDSELRPRRLAWFERRGLFSRTFRKQFLPSQPFVRSGLAMNHDFKAAATFQSAQSTATAPIESPRDESLDVLCRLLAENADRWQGTGDWPAEALAACARAGVFRWFLPEAAGGLGWSEVDQTRGYLRLATADLTTTFIITQFIGACRRMAGGENPQPAQRWLQPLLSGQAFATVGISHLTTSRRHLGKPVLNVVEESKGGYRLSGMSPWVTGAAHADVIVLAGTLEDGRELLAAVPTNLPGIECHPGAQLIALTASCTDRVTLQDVRVESEMILAGPVNEVMRSGSGAATGGLQTSTLAIGLARSASNYLVDEASKRPDLAAVADTFVAQTDEITEQLLNAAAGANCDTGQLRGGANRLVLRATQAALTAAKGAGFVQGHPVGRWCREALFFLVWSCPQPVATAHLCELAGIEA